MSRRLIILLSVIGVLVIGGSIGAVALMNFLKGGADSPEQAVTKSVEALTKKDLVGVFTMISPHERDSLVRVQEAIIKKATDERIADAAKSVADQDSDQGGSELVFDGVDLTFSGISPTVSQVSDDVAVVHVSSGEVKLHIDPAQTKGAIRSAYDNVENPEVTDETWNISDLGPSKSGLSVVASKKDGRWYLNIGMSVLEAINAQEGLQRGDIPSSVPVGSDDPQTAAKAAVQASQALSPSQLAPFLVKDEANVLYLYGHLWDKYVPNAGSSKFSFGNVAFTEGPRDGNRAQAYVDQVSINSGSNDRITMTDRCINNASSSSDEVCLNGSAYQAGGYSSGSINWLSALLSHDGKFALTTVNEDGKWKVSVLDTLADHIVSATKSLTHEQTLAVAGLARSEQSSGAIAVGESKELQFNNAGYAVTTLKVDKSMMLTMDKKSTLGNVRLYSSDGKTEGPSARSSQYSSETAEPGEYKVVVWAGSDFAEDFAKNGNSAKGSSSLRISEYVKPATIDGDTRRTSVSLTTKVRTFKLEVPSAEGEQLLVTTSSASTGAKIVAVVDGKSYEVHAGKDKTTTIPVGAGNHTLEMSVQQGSSKSYFTYAFMDLSFDKQ
ncbi:hypothetical protein [Paenarthrobacter nitroguajacolicus]|uniref:hypothetical protein n=1 Tax=Paenarthrobacter nitroguajacolicus TaxID=211146 RepID=UPI0040545831